jgi:hypothetical protein
MGLRNSLSALIFLPLWLLALQGAAPAAVLIAATCIGPYRSTDGGATWKQIFIHSGDPKLQGFPKLNCLAVDPQNPSTGMILSIHRSGKL